MCYCSSNLLILFDQANLHAKVVAIRLSLPDILKIFHNPLGLHTDYLAYLLSLCNSMTLLLAT